MTQKTTDNFPSLDSSSTKRSLPKQLEMSVLKAMTVEEKPWLAKIFISFFKDIVNWLLEGFRKPKLHNSMCKYYGHVVRGTWTGYLPSCADCGAQISSPEELRKALPKTVTKSHYI